MKKGYKKLLYFISTIIIILFINILNQNIFSGYRIDIFISVLLIIFNVFFVIEKDHHRYMSDILFEILLYVILYFILFYLLGLVVGLARTHNYLNMYGLKTFILPIMIYCVLREFFRYNMLCKADENKVCTVMVVILFVFLDLTNTVIPKGFESQYDVLKYFALTLLPTISRNISYTYVSKNMGYKPVILFDLIFSLYPYIIPILPNPSEYMMSIIYIMVPVLFAFRIVKFFENKNDGLIMSDYHKKRFNGILIPIITISIMVYFYSGYFRYYAIAIASGSMEPKIHIGDVVIVDQKTNKSKLEKGNVIAFKYHDVVVVHRIYKIIKLDGKRVYYTKGDANNHVDDFLTEESSIIGKVSRKVTYAGYPKIWFNKESSDINEKNK